jgi:hypothetical protein
MDDTNPPFELTPTQHARIRPLADYPRDMYRVHILAWHDGHVWRGMWGGPEGDGWRADSALHRTHALAGVPTHYVEDRG